MLMVVINGYWMVIQKMSSQNVLCFERCVTIDISFVHGDMDFSIYCIWYWSIIFMSIFVWFLFLLSWVVCFLGSSLIQIWRTCNGIFVAYESWFGFDICDGCNLLTCTMNCGVVWSTSHSFPPSKYLMLTYFKYLSWPI